MGAFGQRLKELRKQRGISQNELSKYIGVSKSSVNMYERGEREPSFETLEAIADFFNVNMDYLLGRSPLNEFLNSVSLEPLSKSARIVLSKLLSAFANSDEEDLPKIWEEVYKTFTFSDMKYFAEFVNLLCIAFAEECLNSTTDEELREELQAVLEEQKRWREERLKYTSDKANTDGTA